MNNLYWVDNKIMKLYDRFTDAETGELCDWKDEDGNVIAPVEDFFTQLEALDMERKDVIENLLLGYKNDAAEAEAIKLEISRLTARKKYCEKRAERFKAAAADALNGENYKSGKVAVRWITSYKTTSDDENIAPDEYMRVKVEKKPDKGAIKAAIKSGVDVPGWWIAESKSMSVK